MSPQWMSPADIKRRVSNPGPMLKRALRRVVRPAAFFCALHAPGNTVNLLIALKSIDGAMTGKVFCIGFHKTGTSSLERALTILGYRVTGPNGVRDRKIGTHVLALAQSLVPKFDAFQDNPWPVIYKEMDAAWPGSKFILTQRDPEAWLRSQVRHFGKKTRPMREWIYGAGCPEGNEDIYRERFLRHYREVPAYFADRPNDLLVMDLAAGDGWEKLCPFLGKEIPNQPFPHANKAATRDHRRRWSHRIQRVLGLRQ